MPKAPDVQHLLAGVKRGDADAFAALVRAMTEPLFRYTAGMLGDADAAEEVVQKAFLRVYRRRARLGDAGSLRALCYRIAGNLARNHMRDDRRRRGRIEA